MSRLLVLVLMLCPFAYGQNLQVRSERGRFSIECQSAPLEEVLRKIAADSPMELWLDEGLSGKRVTARVEGATLKQALEEVFEEVKDVNYVFTFDPSNPERVTKIYAGGGGGSRLGRTPTVAASEDESEATEPMENPTELPPELDPEAPLDSPEAQEALDALKELPGQRSGEEVESSDAPSTELEDLLKNLPPLPESPAKKEKPKGSR